LFLSRRGLTKRFEDVTGTTFKDMLTCFDSMILALLPTLTAPYSDIPEDEFCKSLCAPGALQRRRDSALMIISQELRRVYDRPVVVLIDDYDSPMHCAIEHGFSSDVRSFILLYCSYLMLF
jgi:hypothetical protein